MVPGKTWGDMGPEEREYWKAHKCDSVVGGRTKQNCPCPEVERGKVKYMPHLAIIILSNSYLPLTPLNIY